MVSAFCPVKYEVRPSIRPLEEEFCSFEKREDN